VRWKIAAVLVLTVAALVWVLHGIDPAQARVQVETFHWWYYVPIFVIYQGTSALRVWRLQWVLGRKLAFWPTFSALSIGYLALNALPLRLGELVRPYLMAERQDVPFGTGLGALMVERLADVLALLVMVWLCVFWVDLPPGAILVGGTDILAAGQRVAGAVLVVGTLGFVALVLSGERGLRFADRIPVLGRILRRFVEALQSLWSRPADGVRILLITAVIWTLTMVAVRIQLTALPGLPNDIQSTLVVWTATLSGMSAVPTPGFFGGFEAFCVAALLVLGASPDAARVFAVLLHLGQFVCTVVTGLAFTIYEGVSLREVVTRSRASAGSP
jgi:uncharacterized protein (TIRG00374 family)